jgi:DNA-binding NarL/FixJ family response regulator
MIRVALADDHSGIRTAIRCLLEHSSDIVVVGEADNGHAALKMAQELNPDVLVLDIDMPGMSGLEVIHQLKLIKSPVSVLVLSAYAAYYRMSDMAATKIAKYIEKKDAHIFLVDGVHELAAGKQPLYTH